MGASLPLSTWPTARKYILLLVLLLVLIPLFSSDFPYGQDWLLTYRPASLAVLEGKSPYSVEIYYAAPWAAWLLIPIAVLPPRLGWMLLLLVGLACYTYTAIRLGAKPVALMIFLCSSVVLGCLFQGNIEWMALLGAVLPPPIGLIFLAVKPQVGAGLAVYWLIMIWWEDGFRKVAFTFAPVAGLLLLSFLLYGLWPLRFSQAVTWNPYNSSIFPYGGFVPGILLLIAALKWRDPKAGLASGPLLAPYVILFTWAAMLVYFLQKPKVLLVLVLLLWIPSLVRFLFSV